MKSNVLSVSYKGYEIPVDVGGNDWNQYSNLPYNVQHHVLSLRWLPMLGIEDAIKVLVDFVGYFSRAESKTGFYLGKHADHTSVIRLSVFKKYYELEISSVQKELLMNEMLKISNSIISGETYNSGTNHALMSDIEILRLSSFLGLEKESIKRISDRLFGNLDVVFDLEVGSTKEHSISYQEFNLNLMNKISKVLVKIDSELLDSEKLYQFEVLMLKVKEFSRYLLYSAYVPGRGYLPLGDSFEAYKENVLKEVFGVDSPGKLLDRFERPMIFFSSSFGVYIYRSRDCVFSFKNSFHSMVHKQNDDLGITLDLFGCPIFIDGGHHDIMTKQLSLKGAHCHSVPVVDGLKMSNDVSFCAESYLAMDGSGLTVSGGHKRFSGVILSRGVELKSNTLVIRDFFGSESGVVSSQFVLSPFVKVSTVSEGSVFMKFKNHELNIRYDGHLALDRTKVIFNEEEHEVDRLVITLRAGSTLVVTLPEEIGFSSDSDIVCDSFFRSMGVS